MTLDFEMRRIIFGLASLVKNDNHSLLPQMIYDQLPLIFKWIAFLSNKMLESRSQDLKSKEKNFVIEEQQNEDDDDSSEFESEESEEEFAEMNKRILELKARNEAR
jgi:hypothetical protein